MSATVLTAFVFEHSYAAGGTIGNHSIEYSMEEGADLASKKMFKKDVLNMGID